ncbi:MAG: pyruvate, phosphate dikinase [Elusimicrobia bacterium]|nr:pyruvate, phosphate dikinase [Elusimicrobiota bacterium]
MGQEGEGNTGLRGLDHILRGVRLGDNVVFRVDTIEEYRRLVIPFAEAAQGRDKPLVYFRFADHPDLLPEAIRARRYVLHPQAGFETFITEILDVIERCGKGAFYVFDSLSELAVDWSSDRMLGNFFMITCPYLFELDTVAYFALLRNQHTALATDAIQRTAQVVLDVYQNNGTFYVHPLKVDGRHSPTMYMLHKWEGAMFIPVTRSAEITEILAGLPHPWLDFSLQHRDIWTRHLMRAQELVRDEGSGPAAALKDREFFLHLLRMLVTRDPQLLSLAEKYLDMTDVVNIGKRMIGTGLIGGKSAGMLIARAVLRKTDPAWEDKLEAHDSFFIGADVFYTYLIRNKCWWIRRRLKTADDGLRMAAEARERILSGEFTDDTRAQFMGMLQYFGQAPIIVRSSSLLEDAYGNAFSGKYDSVFCANQGTPEERLKNFMAAVRTVYASTMSPEALAYRAHWGLMDRDEQMGLLVQRVSGAVYGTRCFPQVAGVGFSYNPFVWSRDIDPEAGMLRIVFGLGTRAVDRIDDDYTRIVALNAPSRRPEMSGGDVRKYTQHKVDVLDLQANTHASCDFADAVGGVPGLPLEIFASRDPEMERYAVTEGRQDLFPWVLTFDDLLSRREFVEDMRGLLKTLQEAYAYPVDIEFTANFTDESQYRINLLQCRPFQVKGNILSIEKPGAIDPEGIILESSGPVIGSSRAITVDRLIYVVPEAYAKLNESQRYSVARLVGRLTHLKEGERVPTILLAGPGRWATTTPFLGVPVSFAEISRVSVLCEIAVMHAGLAPEISLGTHFFNDLVEADMLYFGLHPDREGNILDPGFFGRVPNSLARLLPDAERWGDVVRVIETSSVGEGMGVHFHTDVLKQSAVCYLAPLRS